MQSPASFPGSPSACNVEHLRYPLHCRPRRSQPFHRTPSGGEHCWSEYKYVLKIYYLYRRPAFFAQQCIQPSFFHPHAYADGRYPVQLRGQSECFWRKNGALPVHRYVIYNYCAGGIIQLSKSWFLHPETMSKEDLFAQYHTMISLFFATISPELS